jgi:hypothetical protein
LPAPQLAHRCPCLPPILMLTQSGLMLMLVSQYLSSSPADPRCLLLIAPWRWTRGHAFPDRTRRNLKRRRAGRQTARRRRSPFPSLSTGPTRATSPHQLTRKGAEAEKRRSTRTGPADSLGRRLSDDKTASQQFSSVAPMRTHRPGTHSRPTGAVEAGARPRPVRDCQLS